MSVDAPDLAVFLFVLALRLFVPLGILRYPLPAILASLVIDAADQTIFQRMTDIDLEELNYQGYDKALDIYYLTIAYIATFRNWKSGTAIAVAAALWYYRLVGVALFELTEWRPLLIIFPNTFEYFFIFMAVVRLRWDTDRLSNRQIIGAAAAIWIFIKLPQEYWIHIAQLDTTDVMKEQLFGVEATDSWGTAFSNRPLVLVVLVVAVVGLFALLAQFWSRLPPADHPLTFDADRLPGPEPVDPLLPRRWNEGLGEKLVLTTLVTVIFANALGDTPATTLEIAVGVGLVVSGNALLTQFVRRFDAAWSTTLRAFATTLLVNVAILIAYRIVAPSDDEDPFYATAFFLLLLSLIIALFDRYRPPKPYAETEIVTSTVTSTVTLA
ncbi:MAG: hypothetical protein OEV40_08165 [Acidimicrobiia bacterium]|nr:hypothetical protein [Acidimicrobiia bacterium]